MVLFIIAACSGTGKSTLVRSLLERQPRLRLSVSHTTRAPRPGEQDGREYRFVDRAAFEATRDANGFAEWAEYAGNLYGTARSTVDAARANGLDLLLEVEVQGARRLREVYPDAVSAFVLPPSWAALEKRLRSRGTEEEASIQRRLAVGRGELAAAGEFEHLVVNAAIPEAVADLEHIYCAARLRAVHRASLISDLLGGDAPSAIVGEEASAHG